MLRVLSEENRFTFREQPCSLSADVGLIQQAQLLLNGVFA
jgi:hypothetical protein